jgi:hypothetical protein
MDGRIEKRRGIPYSNPIEKAKITLSKRLFRRSVSYLLKIQ